MNRGPPSDVSSRYSTVHCTSAESSLIPSSNMAFGSLLLGRAELPISRFSRHFTPSNCEQTSPISHICLRSIGTTTKESLFDLNVDSVAGTLRVAVARTSQAFLSAFRTRRYHFFFFADITTEKIKHQENNREQNEVTCLGASVH